MARLGMSRSRFALLLFPIVFLAGCGGGGNSSQAGGDVPPPPAPTLSSIVPSSVVAGAPSLTIQANGTNFSNDSIVRWNVSSLQTTFVSSTQLTAIVPSSDLANAGAVQISISNHQTGGGESAA